MPRRSFSEIIDQEWAQADPENWVVEPTSWLEGTLDLETPLSLGEVKGHPWRLRHTIFHEPEAQGAASLEPVRSRHTSDAADRFQQLVDEWKRETIIDSSVQRRAMHRAYQRIIGMGWDAVPLILVELEREPDYWFWALSAITDEDPARDETTLQGARERWLEWARQRGL